VLSYSNFSIIIIIFIFLGIVSSEKLFHRNVGKFVMFYLLLKVDIMNTVSMVVEMEYICIPFLHYYN